MYCKVAPEESSFPSHLMNFGITILILKNKMHFFFLIRADGIRKKKLVLWFTIQPANAGEGKDGNWPHHVLGNHLASIGSIQMGQRWVSLFSQNWYYY